VSCDARRLSIPFRHAKRKPNSNSSRRDGAGKAPAARRSLPPTTSLRRRVMSPSPLQSLDASGRTRSNKARIAPSGRRAPRSRAWLIDSADGAELHLETRHSDLPSILVQCPMNSALPQTIEPRICHFRRSANDPRQHRYIAAPQSNALCDHARD